MFETELTDLDVDYSVHNKCDKCKRLVKPKDALSMLIPFLDENQQQVYFCIDCTSKIEIPLPAEIIRVISLQRAKVK